MPVERQSFGSLNNASQRSINESIILNLIRKRQPISRADLARSTRLKESTVSSIVKELLRRGMVAESGLGESAGGRRPRMLRLNGSAHRVLAIDVAAELTTLGIADLNGKLLCQSSSPTEKDPKRFLKRLVMDAESLAKDQVRPPAQLQGIGVSTLGLVDPAEGAIVYSSSLDWHDVRIGAALRRAFRQEIAFDERVRAAGRAEAWFGGLEPERARNMAVAVVREGIGCALFAGGRILWGSTMGAGQFGHVVIEPGGEPCRCGSCGCWEAYAAEPAVVRRYRSLAGCGETGIDAAAIAERAHEGETSAVATLRETGAYLGAGLAVLVNSMNPAAIVIESKLAKAWPLLEPEIWKMIRQRALEPNWRSLAILPSRIEGNPCLLGAVGLALERRFRAPRVGEA